jgi:hypothetical protein
MKVIVSILLALTGLCGCGTNPVWKTQTFVFAEPAAPPPTTTPTNFTALKPVSISPFFQSQSFTYRVGESAYEKDPYATFLVSPERTLTQAIRAWLRAGGAFGRVVEPGSELTPNLIAEATVSQLCGDFRDASHPGGVMEIHFVVYETHDGAQSRIVLDKNYTRTTPLGRKTPTALMAAWETDLSQIMGELNSDYAKANSNDSGR